MRPVLLFSLLLLAAACSKDLGRIDPNVPTDVPLSLLLPSAEVSVGIVHSTEIAWYAAVFTQQQAGVDRQMASADRYGVVDADMNRPWNSAYANALQDLKLISDKATAQSAPAYRGIARILTAATLGQVTDAWGDVPWTEALQGSANIRPKYDAQEAVYATIQTLLSGGIADLQGEPAGATPSTDDLIYGGDLTLWVKTARALQARYYNHLSRRDPVGSAQRALATLDAGAFEGIYEDASVPFGTAQTAANPWWQFVNQRGDLRMGAYLTDYMDSTGDPRLPVYAARDGAGGYSGSPAGAPDLTASVAGNFLKADARVTVAGYAEQRFIEAEAAVRTGDLARAATAYNAAVQASLDGVGVGSPAFEEGYIRETAGSISLEKILSQKYVALFLQAEAWADHRRTGIPALAPAAGGLLGGAIPGRLPYSLDEKTYNGAAVPSVPSMAEPVWWAR